MKKNVSKSLLLFTHTQNCFVTPSRFKVHFFIEDLQGVKDLYNEAKARV